MSHIEVASAVIPGGFLAEWLRYIEPYESPVSYDLFSLLAAASCGINRRILVNQDGMPEVWTNLYVVLLGPSGCRKGEAMKRANKLLGEAVENAPLLPRTFSMEACINNLVQRSDETDRGSGIIVAPEFNRLIGGRDYMKANADFLTDIYDCDDPFTRETIAHGYQEIHKPYIVLQGAIQPTKLELIDESILTTGLLRRMIIISENEPRKMLSNPVKDKTLFEALVQVMRKRMAFKVHEDHDGDVAMELTQEAMDLKESWYTGYVHDTWINASEKEGHFASCMESHALKLGAIINVLESGRGDVLTAEYLHCAQKLIEAFVPAMFHAYEGLASTPFGRLRAAVLRGLQAAGGLIEGDLLTRSIVSSSGAKPKEVREAAYSLVEEGRCTIPEENWLALPNVEEEKSE